MVRDVVAYGNARLPHALLVVGAACADDRMISAGLESLDWLSKSNIAKPTAILCRSVRKASITRAGRKPASISSPLKPRERSPHVSTPTASRATNRWRTEAWSAFNWFLGDNDLQLPLYDSVTGGCRDGLHPERANQNQGAESTLSFLMALLEMRLVARSL